MKFSLALAVMVTAVGVQAPPVITPQPTAPPSSASLSAWKPCAEDASAECAALTVPIDWEHPTSATTTIAVARHHATDAKSRVGSLLVNPGGPGLSGVAMALDTTKFSAELRQRFDIVGFDPRGIGASQPVACHQETTAPSTPHNEKEFAELVSRNKKLAQDCAATDPLAAHLDAKSVAKDVEALRVALGNEPLNWYGTSYGTEIGQQYAELFPTHIRSMVLDATIDHSSSALTHLLTSTASAESTFTRFTRWCQENTACALHGQDAGAIFDQIITKAEKSPLKANGRVFTADDIQTNTYLALYAPEQGWPGLGQALAVLRDAPQTTDSPMPDQPTDLATRAAVCQDWNYDVHNYAQFSGLISAAHMVAPHLKIATVARYRLLDCVGWPVTDAPHRIHAQGAPPVLVINSKHDPITPYSGARNVSRQLPNSALLTYEGDGHTTYPRSPCVQGFVDSYLSTRTIPPRGSSCPDLMRS